MGSGRRRRIFWRHLERGVRSRRWSCRCAREVTSCSPVHGGWQFRDSLLLLDFLQCWSMPSVPGRRRRRRRALSQASSFVREHRVRTVHAAFGTSPTTRCWYTVTRIRVAVVQSQNLTKKRLSSYAPITETQIGHGLGSILTGSRPARTRAAWRSLTCVGFFLRSAPPLLTHQKLLLACLRLTGNL